MFKHTYYLHFQWKYDQYHKMKTWGPGTQQNGKTNLTQEEMVVVGWIYP